jgi:hypothetical protein
MFLATGELGTVVCCMSGEDFSIGESGKFGTVNVSTEWCADNTDVEAADGVFGDDVLRHVLNNVEDA